MLAASWSFFFSSRVKTKTSSTAAIMENKARRVGRFINEDVSLSGSSTAASLEVIGWKRGLSSAV